MKPVVLICTAALASCTSQSPIGCPAIERLMKRDAVADARAALAKGDRHLLMLGGFVGTVPGVVDDDGYPTLMMDGTSDMETVACLDLHSVAEAYATKYNQTIARGL